MSSALGFLLAGCATLALASATEDSEHGHLSLLQVQATAIFNKPGHAHKKAQTHALKADFSLSQTVSLNNGGYLSLVHKGTPEMVSFIRRVGESRGFSIADEGKLHGFAKFYSGEAASSSFQGLVDELGRVGHLTDGWLEAGVGASAKLNDEGYETVLKEGTSSQMAAYIRRVIKAHGLVVANEGSLAGFANFYKNQVGAHSLVPLVHELDNISQLPDGWLKPGTPPLTGLSAPLNPAGCSAVQKQLGAGATDEMAVFVRRVAEANGYHIADEGKFKGFAKYYSNPKAGGFPRLVDELHEIAKSPTSWQKAADDTKPTGLNVNMDAAGCKALKEQFVMGSEDVPVFIRRVAESRLYGIADEGGLQGFAKYYSGQKGTWGFAHLVEELDKIGKMRHGWLKGLGLD